MRDVQGCEYVNSRIQQFLYILMPFFVTPFLVAIGQILHQQEPRFSAQSRVQVQSFRVFRLPQSLETPRLWAFAADGSASHHIRAGLSGPVCCSQHGGGCSNA